MIETIFFLILAFCLYFGFGNYQSRGERAFCSGLIAGVVTMVFALS